MYIFKKKKKKMSLQSTLPLRIDGRPNGTSPLASSGLLGTLLSSPLHECQISERKGWGGGGGGVGGGGNVT